MIKEFLNDWNNAEDKHDRAYVVENNIGEVCHIYLEKSNRNEQQLRKLRGLFLSKKFAKTLYRLIVKNRSEVSPLVVPVLADILITHPVGEENELVNATLTLTDDIGKMYLEIIETVLKKKVRKVCKKTGLNESLVKNLLIECPEDLESKEGPQAYFYINRVIRKMYGILLAAQDDAEKALLLDVDTIDTLIGLVVGDSLKVKVAFNILLEKYDKTKYLTPDQIAMWNTLSEFALNTIEDIGKKKEIAEVVEHLYIKRRRIDKKNQRDGQRRLDLTELNEDDYPKTVKAIKSLLKEYGQDVKSLLV